MVILPSFIIKWLKMHIIWSEMRTHKGKVWYNVYMLIRGNVKIYT